MRSTYFQFTSSNLVALALTASLAAAGCGSKYPPTYPVKGTVTYPDDEPLKEGMVEFESEPQDKMNGQRVNARGVIHEDGSFFLSTFEDGDGAVVGPHRAIVREPYPEADVEEGESLPPPTVDRMYWDYNTSELTYTVEEKDDNFFKIVLKRPRPR